MRLPEDLDSQLPSVNILPMIDVIFAILSFLIISSLYLTKAEGLPVVLPQAVTAVPQNQVDLTLTIKPNGELFLDDQAVPLSGLAAATAQRAAGQPVAVTIRADEQTPHGQVVTAMDELRSIPGISLGIATVRP